MYDWKGEIAGFVIGKEVHNETTISDTYGFVFIKSQSIEGYFHALVFVDAATGYRWIYELKTEDEALNMVK